MKKKSLLFIFLMIHLSVLSQGIDFIESMDSWEAVVQKSKAENKPIFVDVYTEWCGPCKWMDQNVFNQSEVGENMNAAFINVKVDAEKGWGVAFKNEYGVAAYPTYLFFDPEGEVIYTAGGSKPQETFLSISNRALENWKSGLNSKSIEELLSKHAQNPDSIRSILTKLGGNDPRTSYLLDIYLDVLPPEERLTDQTIRLIQQSLDSPVAPTSKALSILLEKYHSSPIHSTNLMSPWMTLNNLIQASIDSAAINTDLMAFEDLLDFSSQMYTHEKLNQIHQLYYQGRYHAIAKNHLEFTRAFEQYMDYVFKETTSEEWEQVEYADLMLRLPLEFGVHDLNELDKENKDRALRSHLSAIRMIQQHLRGFIVFFKERLPAEFERYDKDKIDRALVQLNELYANNPIYVNSFIVTRNEDFLEKYKQ